MWVAFGAFVRTTLTRHSFPPDVEVLSDHLLAFSAADAESVVQPTCYATKYQSSWKTWKRKTRKHQPGWRTR